MSQDDKISMVAKSQVILSLGEIKNSCKYQEWALSLGVVITCLWQTVHNRGAHISTFHTTETNRAKQDVLS